MQIYYDELRAKSRLAQRGKGNRRNRRFVQLARTDFETVRFFDVFHNLTSKDDRPTAGEVSNLSDEDCRLYEVGKIVKPSSVTKSYSFTTLHVRIIDGKEVLV